LKNDNEYSKQKEEYDEKERVSIEIHELSKHIELKEK
jgi:hypothetical protein